MTSRQSFFFDAAACSGCKACQVACKDRHGLEVGRLWRRVSEVTGGGWEKNGAAWRNNIFAYHLSISCNHCDRPICLEGCPARAITRREDGIVLINPGHCLGCGYCSWVCPYSAPQYQPDRGVMTKCNLCAEDLDAGCQPACVAACPVRALDAGPIADLAGRYELNEEPAHTPPLPRAHLTEPSLLMAPHADAHRSSEPDVVLTPRPARGLREISLVVFTLLSQMAAGLALAGGGIRLWLGPQSAPVDAILWPLISSLIALAMGFSTLHLGQPRNAARSLMNLRTSWLSREILLASVFLGCALLAWWGLWPDWFSTAVGWLTVPLALAYLWGMGGVYRQRTVPVWNQLRTPAAFLVSALALGGLGLNAVVWSFARMEADVTSKASIGILLLSVGLVGLPWRLWQMYQTDKSNPPAWPNFLGSVGNALGLGLLALLLTKPELMTGPLPVLMSWGLLLLVGADQVVQRRRYYGGYERLGV